MSELNKRYTEVMKDVMSALLPMIKSIDSKGLDDPMIMNMTNITIKSVSLGGDMMQAIDDLQKNQLLLKEQLDRLEETCHKIEHENFQLNEKMLETRKEIGKKIDDAYANCVALLNN